MSFTSSLDNTLNPTSPSDRSFPPMPLITLQAPLPAETGERFGFVLLPACTHVTPAHLSIGVRNFPCYQATRWIEVNSEWIRIADKL